MTNQFGPNTFVPAPARRFRLLDLPANIGSAFFRLALRREQLRELRQLRAMSPAALADIGLSRQALAACQDCLMATPLRLGTPGCAIMQPLTPDQISKGQQE
jgi:uncharacterized protein YjiS (DUF1127 family)